jgi:photosystem II stability/assembly factor-like uncharacterized protein
MKINSVIVAFLLLIVCAWTAYSQSRGVDLSGIPSPYNFQRYQRTSHEKLWIVGGDGNVTFVSSEGRFNRSIETEVDLSAVFFVTDDKGWVVGENGSIFFTTDQGQSWSQQETDINVDLTAIFCSDESNCWAVGEEETILKYKPSEKRWNKVRAGPKNTLYSVFFLNSTDGWSCGQNGVVLHTTDGGNTWHSQLLKITTVDLFDGPMPLQLIRFKDRSVGWVSSNSGIAFTKDGGEHWSISSFPRTANVIGLVQIDTDRILAVGNPSPNWESADLGRTWFKQRATGSGEGQQ